MLLESLQRMIAAKKGCSVETKMRALFFKTTEEDVAPMLQIGFVAENGGIETSYFQII